jgi:cytochrome c-type biogenesis protein
MHGNMNPTLNKAQGVNLNRRLIVFLHALLFVLGFSLVFIIGWGGAATLLGEMFGTYKATIGRIGGVVVILFGLSTLNVLKIPWLNYDTRPQWSGRSRNGLLASALMGVFFAAGWTPCIGTTLGAILTLGFSGNTAAQAMVLSSGYALGLGIPFLIIGLGMDRAVQFVQRFGRHLRYVQFASGMFLILIGVMMLTNQITLIGIWAQRNGLFLDLPLGMASAPTYFIAVLAGLISFLSPCVLPLVPAYVGYLSGHAFRSVEVSKVP